MNYGLGQGNRNRRNRGGFRRGLHSILLENLTRDEMEEFAGEMIKAAVMERIDLGEAL